MQYIDHIIRILPFLQGETLESFFRLTQQAQQPAAGARRGLLNLEAR